MLKIVLPMLLALNFIDLVYSERAFCAEAIDVTLQTQEPGPTIHRELFGQFAEHIGEGIYGGIWVGKDSAIPNVNGIRLYQTV